MDLKLSERTLLLPYHYAIIQALLQFSAFRDQCSHRKLQEIVYLRS